MAGKTFKRAAGVEPVWFELPGPNPDEEIRFDCLRVLPGGVILDFGEAMNGDGAASMEALTNLFKVAVIPEQYERFQEVIHEPRCEVGVEMLSDVATFLASQYTGDRPTGASSAPTSSKTESGNGSTAGALREVSTYSRSTPPVPIH